MKKNTCVFIILGSVLGLLISCNGEQRPLGDVQSGNGVQSGDDNQPGTSGTANTTPKSTQGVDNEVTGSKSELELIGGEFTGSVDDAQQQVVFSNIQPLFQKHCIYCHVPGAPPTIPTINWVDYAVAKSYVDNGKLYERIWTLRENEEKGMPMGNGFEMTEEERDLIVSWIKDGGLQ